MDQKQFIYFQTKLAFEIEGTQNKITGDGLLGKGRTTDF